MSDRKNGRLDDLFNLLAHADDTYDNLPTNIRLDIENIAQSLPEYGPRLLSRRGIGTEFFESRDFRPDTDDPHKINARLSGRAGRPIMVEKQAEISQHVYMWRDPSESMNYASTHAPYSKKQAAEIMLLALTKHLSKNDERIGIIDTGKAFKGGKAAELVSSNMIETTNVITGHMMPVLPDKIPPQSTAILFSDFMMEPREIEDNLNHLSNHGLRGFFMIVLDPQELDFNFKGHIEFQGMEGEASTVFKRTESMQDQYREAMRTHIDWLREACAKRGFQLIIQRTDEPLHEGLLSVYGLNASSHHNHAKPKMV